MRTVVVCVESYSISTVPMLAAHSAAKLATSCIDGLAYSKLRLLQCNCTRRRPLTHISV